MLVFVDESGDTGFKLYQGSSGQFTITLVVFPKNEEAEATSYRIDKLRADLGLLEDSAKGEFHFNDNSNDQREAFLRTVSKFDFAIFSVVVDKAGLPQKVSATRMHFITSSVGWSLTTPRAI